MSYEPRPATTDHTTDDRHVTAEVLRQVVDDRQPLAQTAERLLRQAIGNNQ